MSKVICDICGTAFADTADQCPICGTAKSDASRPVPGGDTADSGYAYVKGGRFSQANVRKFNSGKRDLPRTEEPEPRVEAPSEEPTPKVVKEETPKKEKRQTRRRDNDEEPEDQQPSNIPLIIIVVILLIAVVSACAYIGKYVIDKYSDRNSQMNESSSTSPTDSTPPSEILCQGISITGPVAYQFTSATDSAWIEVICDPVDTTELLEWTYDSAVVNVTKNGDMWYISAVAPGETDITVRCGAFEDTITVTCAYEVAPEPPEPTDPEPTEPTEPTEPAFVLEWCCDNDITLFSYGAKWRIYDGSVPVSEITFTSSNESVATVENGYVYVWSNGDAVITASYGDQTITMIVRGRRIEQPVESEYSLSRVDVTLPVGTSFTLALMDSNGVKVTDVIYSVSEEGFFTVNEKGVVTGVAATGTQLVYVCVEYEGVVYKCRVIVTEA